MATPLPQRAALAALALTALLFSPAQAASSQQRDPLSAQFGLCGRSVQADNCVIDGDTFRMAGEKVRIADIDTPETHGARCGAEGALGRQATMRLQALLNAGPFAVASYQRDRDRYGRLLRLVTRQGQSIGALLVAEGLARPWSGARQPWCRS
ncbi:thermonuclease family protein [Sphingobium sp. EP60837]|jgi:micrococcal nuclease|uniref:thermonuclease family protein n=1 Tax=Sphingobium sp. EP60837 TaxID=1855519 RepID=UPI0007DCC248|nr:thermonuclease family protein [Sphingobium sp. EP60837]ANI78228.1 hypothetical protein EP837_01816 [Sphingobium sp. EP60837]